MDPKPPAPDSFRKLIHDLNQQVFLLRGHCELCKASEEDAKKVREHLEHMEAALEGINKLATQLKQKQLELAPEE